MIYSATDITAISDEIVAMLSAYIPSLLLVFGALFALYVFRKQFKSWTGF